MRYTLIFIFVLIAIVLLGFVGTILLTENSNQESALPLFEIPATEVAPTEVIVEEEPATTTTTSSTTLLRPMLTTSSTLSTSTTALVGEASGTWFFEGSFPVEVRDTNNTVLESLIATFTTGTWMTEDPVAFSIPFDASPYAGQTLIIAFIKDNPSGFAALDDVETTTISIAN